MHVRTSEIMHHAVSCILLISAVTGGDPMHASQVMPLQVQVMIRSACTSLHAAKWLVVAAKKTMEWDGPLRSSYRYLRQYRYIVISRVKIGWTRWDAPWLLHE